MDVPEKIDCVDCGQPAYRLTEPPEEGWEIGDYVAYRCSGCNDRWDLVVSDESEEGPAPPSLLEEARSIIEERRRDAAE